VNQLKLEANKLRWLEMTRWGDIFWNVESTFLFFFSILKYFSHVHSPSGFTRISILFENISLFQSLGQWEKAGEKRALS